MRPGGQRHIIPYDMIFYGIAAFWLLLYFSASSLPRFDISPTLRALLLLLICLSAYLGARLPRAGEVYDRAVIRRRVRRVMWLCFALYLHLVLIFTLFDPRMGRDFWGFLHATADDRAAYIQWQLNLTPMHTVRAVYLNGFRNGLIGIRYVLLNLAGNLFVFVPFAFFLPYLWRGVDRFWKFTLLMLTFAVLIELCQLATMCGSCDIDDVILNVGGALPFWFILRIPPLRRVIDRLMAI